ncbi:hypothetical protein ACSDQ9_02325 [Aestuariimicrobium soli]|uniref:hypothetical protein n=1 Tax=Aestuariimicrobium soli TaxID=2035834 RepID=UPI003EBDE030
MTTRHWTRAGSRWAAGLVATALIGAGLSAPPPAAGEPTPTTFEAENLAYVLAGGASRSGCDACSGHGKVGNLSSSSTATITGVIAEAAGTHTVRLSYLAGDDSRRLALGVNGEPGPVVSLPSTGGWDKVGTLTIEVDLRAGDNTIVLTAPDGSWGPDVDKLDIAGVTSTDWSFPQDPKAADPVPRDTTAAAPGGRTVSFGQGSVRVTANLDRGTSTVTWSSGKATVRGLHSTAVVDGDLLSTKRYAIDGTCSAAATTITCTAPGLPTLTQRFTFDGADGFFVQLSVTGTDSTPVSASMMVPVATDGANSVTLNATPSTRVLLTPYDNDHWVRYENPDTATVTPAKRSFEVTSLIDPGSRQGLVVGSVDMTHWKSGVVMQGNSTGGLDRLQATAGLTDWSYAYTGVNRFNSPREKRSHRPLVGMTVDSPRMFVGWSSDWRTGMETYGKHVAEASHPLTWDEPTPFGFNSWGGLGARVADDGVLKQTSDFFANELPGFRNQQSTDGTSGGARPYIGIDSYWDALLQPQWSFEDPNTDWSKLEQYVATVRANGQEPAIYFQPFANFWWDGLDNQIGGSEPCDGCERQTMREMTLKVNGTPLSLNGAWALDPTNPGVQRRIALAFDKFNELGIRYIKLDFLTNGYLEADSWYDPTVTNARQAYDRGLSQALSHLHPDTFIDLAISPTFTADHGHARRISCDVHGALNNWHESNPAEYQKSTEYLLNSLTYGWWLDQVYAYNDADHIQFGNYYYDGADAKLFDPPLPRVWSEGVNRARVTSAVITGIYLVSEDFTDSGDPLIKQRAKDLLQNQQVNHLAKIGRSFQPVEVGPDEQKAADTFWLRDGKTVYVAAFNYSGSARTSELAFQRLGIPRGKATVTELWTGAQSSAASKLSISVPAEDVRIYAITLP